MDQSRCACEEPDVSFGAPGSTLILVLRASDNLKDQAEKKYAMVFGNVHVQRKLGVSLYAEFTELLASGAVKVSFVSGNWEDDGLKRSYRCLIAWKFSPVASLEFLMV